MAFSNDEKQEIKDIVLETMTEQSDAVDYTEQVVEFAPGDEVPIVRNGDGTGEKSYCRAPVSMFGGGGSSGVNGIKVGGSGQVLTPTSGVVTLPAYESGAEKNPTKYLKEAAISQDGNSLTIKDNNNETKTFTPTGGGGSSVTPSDADPLEDGTKSAGSATTYSRGDHRHPHDTTKADKSEMAITPGTGENSDKTTIQLKDGMSTTVLTQHQDITGKVDKVNGKGLSSNDYTTDEKNKLNGIETGAEKHKAPTSQEVKNALGTGSGTTKYLREDGQWAEPQGGGGGNTADVNYDTNNKKITKTIDGVTSDVVTVATLKTDMNLAKGDVGLGNVGNFKAVSTVANQDLDATEQSNARANIGAGTSNFDGDYNKLTNKPTIPAAQVQSDWNATTGMGVILNKPSIPQGTVKGAKIGSGSIISPDSSGIVQLPNYTENATPHIAPTAAEVKAALGTGSGTTKYLREDGTWQTPPNSNTTYSLGVGIGDDANKIVLTPSSGNADKITVPYASNAGTVNGKTVAENVPSGAKFTDTTYKFTIGTTTKGDSTNGTDLGTLKSETAVASGTTLSLVTTGEKATWNSKQDALTFNTTPSSANKVATMNDIPSSLPANGGNAATVNNRTVEKNVPSDAVFTDHTYSVMGASGSTHASGLVPDTPSTAGTTKFLREDGQWQVPTIVYPDTAMVEWYMLDNESNNRDNSTDYCMKYAGSKSMLSLVGLDRVYFKQTVTDLSPIFNKNYVISVKFQWYNSNGSWVQTDSYVAINNHNGWWNIPEGAVNGYATFSMYLSSHNADIFREVVEEAKIYSNLVGEGRAIYNEDAPTKRDADYDRYRQSLYLDSLEITRLGYSKWRIGDDNTLGENSVWLAQYEGLVSDSIIDLGKFPGYNAVVVTGDDTYRCWFTFVTKYPTVSGEAVQQSSIYGSAYKHVYVLPKQTLTRLIPSDAKYLVVSWRHGTDSQLTPTSGYLRPKSVMFISDVNLGSLSYAKIFNDSMVLKTYPTLSDEVYRATGKLNEIKLCSWNIGHYSMGDYAYSTITSSEENTKRSQWNSFIEGMFDGKKPDLLLYNEFEHQFSPSYTTASFVDYRVQFEWYKDRYCCLAAYSNIFLQLYDVRYFPYSMYLRNDVFSDAMDYFAVYKTYLNDHVIYICSVHLRSSHDAINLDQCNYLINYFSEYTSVLITGDFNREDMSVFTNAGYTVKITDKTWAGQEAVDHFVYKGYVDIKNEKTIQTNLSDHIPIIATLTTTDNLAVKGTSGQRPSSATTGFRFFDTTMNAPIYKTEFGFWVDSEGNPVSDWWKTLGTLEDSSTTFDDKSVTIAQSTYNSSWGGWANKKNNTIYRKDYTVNGNPFSAGNIIEIVISGAVKNFEWNLAYLDGNGSPVYYIINEDTSRTYNVYRRIIKIPTVEGTLAKIGIRIACDIDYFSGKITINKFQS